MHPRHQLRWRVLLALQKRDLVVVARSLDRQVPEPAVGVDCASGLDHFLHKRQQAFRRGVQDAAHADSSDPRPILLSSDDNQRLTLSLAPTRAFLNAPDVGFVHLDASRQTVPPRSHHRATQLVQPRPCCLVASQSKYPLQPQGAGPVLLRRNPVHRAKPIHQGLARVLEDRPCCHRGLVATFAALQQHRSHWPVSIALTTRAAKTLRPAKPEQVVAARLLRRELGIELAQIAREFLHRPPYYILGLPESSKYPPNAIE